ncbi:MAG: OmpH family outer membrane protein [Deltaproteobacteria bacterium]|nr:OmpH family outer membrane protein [Deltaproteobacteria bacterium]
MHKGETKGKVITLCGVLILSAFGAMAHAAEIKIGYVDMQRALNESTAGKQAKVVMESEYQKFQTEIAQRQKELQATQQTLQKQGLMLSENARKEKEREYQNKLKKFKRWGEDRQAELKQKEMELTKATLEGLAATVKKLGEEEKFTVILEKNEAILLYASKAIDLTDHVIQIFNSSSAK